MKVKQWQDNKGRREGRSRTRDEVKKRAGENNESIINEEQREKRARRRVQKGVILDKST